MTGDDVRDARATLGEAWGLGRPLKAAELGRVLGLTGDRPGETILKWEQTGPSGPASVAIEIMIATGIKPSTFADAFRLREP